MSAAPAPALLPVPARISICIERGKAQTHRRPVMTSVMPHDRWNAKQSEPPSLRSLPYAGMYARNWVACLSFTDLSEG